MTDKTSAGSSTDAAARSSRANCRSLIATRVYLPEPTAASFRLGAVARALAGREVDVEVLTASPTSRRNTYFEHTAGPGLVTVSGWPVLRDATGYVRGYIPYLSFDIPLFFRLLLARRADIALVEPPPTTGTVARIALTLRRTPYVWYAADVWSDATRIAGSPAPVVAVVRWMEKFALRGADGVIAVSDGVGQRVRQLGAKNVRVIPNGIDTSVYHPEVAPLSEAERADRGIVGPYLLYAGTASEWQGAGIFAEAIDQVLSEQPDLQLVYVGQGSQWEEIARTGARLRDRYGRDVIVQMPTASPELVARLLVGARGALVSIVPGRGYDFAYPTKVLAALAAGVPVLYAGKGPVAEDIGANGLGITVDHSRADVARGMQELLSWPQSDSQATSLRQWVMHSRSLDATGEAAAEFLLTVAADHEAEEARAASPAHLAFNPDTIRASNNGGRDPLTVAVVTPWYPTIKNPISGLFVEREVSALRDAGVEVRVIHLDRDIPDGVQSRTVRGGVPVLHIGMNPANPSSVARATGPLRRALASADIVNSHAISSLPAVAVAHKRLPWVHTEHWSALSAPDSASPLLQAVLPAFGSLLRLPDVVVAESERLADPIRRFRGHRPVVLVPCIVPRPPRVAPLDDDELTLRLMSTGGVIDRKNPLLAVRTLAALRRRGVSASLRWIGEGDLREDAVRLATDLGVDATFLGALEPEDVERELAAAHIFFAPTKGDNFFVAAAEALVNGRPICASDQGGHVEYADPRFSEIVFEQTPDAYADALIHLRDKTRTARADAISDSVAERFSPKAVAAQYQAIYAGLV